jgi:hypothetical protein
MPEDNGTLDQLFGRLSRLDSWEERVFASGIILNYCYMKPFAGMFMSVFYPIVPEFMRNFNKAFTLKEQTGAVGPAGGQEADRHREDIQERAMALSEELLALVSKSIDDNMQIAKELG